ncbi:CDP-glycerol glycerophosphotransferase family protein [Halarchaeum acidiphilum]|uniref:CDP-glycerol glycerophosphotransferase family protein n=1 Tax=Halarchaeum acidiphilum TaxID=489138 RepID=UPI000AFB9D29|nr:CDP-glycerol glycerophosphotransferase family protein [Halarchaeum acidiphilum]
MGKIYRGIELLFRFSVYALSHVSPRSDDLVVCTADPSGRFAENPKYVYLGLREREDIDAVWLARADSTANQLSDHGLPVQRGGTLGAKWTLLRAGTVIISHDIVGWELLGGATIVQTWHGNPLKQIGRDTDDFSPLRQWVQDYILRDWDVVTVTGSGTPKQTFTSAFGLSDDDLAVTGSPRNDPLYHDVEYSELDGLDEHAEWRTFISNNRCILYMPTWRRGTHGADGAEFDAHGLDFDTVGSFCEEHDLIFLVKLHPSESSDVGDYEHVLELPTSTDIYDILSEVEVLITDYSSVYFDYLLVDSPIVFYPYDLDSFSSGKGFYFEYDEVTPGRKAFTQPELLTAIDEILSGNDTYVDERADLRNEFFDHQDGHSTQRLIDRVLS